MKVKVVNRYVELLTDIIDTKVRVSGKDVLFDKQYIMSVLKTYEDEEFKITEKIYKETVKWFKERNIFDTVGNTSKLRYRLHPNFKYKVSKIRETVIHQCRFIIGQLFLFSDKFWDESESLYIDVIQSDEYFQFLPKIKSKIVRDTVSTLLIHKHNEDFEGVYTYEILQTLLLTKTPFEIKIKNKSINSTLKGVTLKKVVFNTDTVTVTFNNSQFEIDSLSSIKDIKIPIPKDIYDRIDTSLEYLQKFGDESKDIRDFLNGLKVGKELFFQNILKD